MGEYAEIVGYGVVLIIGWFMKSPWAKNIPTNISTFLATLTSKQLAKMIEVLGTAKGRTYITGCIEEYKG